MCHVPGQGVPFACEICELHATLWRLTTVVAVAVAVAVVVAVLLFVVILVWPAKLRRPVGPSARRQQIGNICVSPI